MFSTRVLARGGICRCVLVFGVAFWGGKSEGCSGVGLKFGGRGRWRYICCNWEI